MTSELQGAGRTGGDIRRETRPGEWPREKEGNTRLESRGGGFMYKVICDHKPGWRKKVRTCTTPCGMVKPLLGKKSLHRTGGTTKSRGYDN